MQQGTRYSSLQQEKISLTQLTHQQLDTKHDNGEISMQLNSNHVTMIIIAVSFTTN